MFRSCVKVPFVNTHELLLLIYGSFGIIFFLNSLSDLMLLNEHCIHHSTDIILFQARRSPFQPCLRLAQMLHRATKWVEESSTKEIGCHRKMWCRQCATAAIYRAIKLLPGQTDRPLPQLLTYGTNGAWKVLQADHIGTTP